jgi:hypothetical protein
MALTDIIIATLLRNTSINDKLSMITYSEYSVVRRKADGTSILTID